MMYQMKYFAFFIFDLTQAVKKCIVGFQFKFSRRAKPSGGSPLKGLKAPRLPGTKTEDERNRVNFIHRPQAGAREATRASRGRNPSL